MKNINSDRIVGIRCDFPNCPLLFILGVYLSSASHDKTEYDEYFDHLWSLYDSLSIQGVVIALGDFNGDLGNSLGDKGKHAPNSRGLKLLELCSHFNICAVNLLSSCNGPVETFVSHCGRFRSTIDYIFVPNSLLNQVITAKTFEMLPDNTSDHVPIQLYLNYSRSLETIKNLPQQMAEIPVSKQKIHWSNFAQEEIFMMYTTPLVSELEILNPDVQNVCKNYVKSITKLILAHSQCLAAPIRKRKRNKMTYVSLPTNVKSARKQCKAAFDSWKNNDFNTTGEVHDDYRFRRKEYCSLLRDLLNQLEVQKSIDFALLLKLTKNCSGSFYKASETPPKCKLFSLKGSYCLMWTRYVICGQSILKHWVLLLPVQILTMISMTELLHMCMVFLLTALKIPQEF